MSPRRVVIVGGGVVGTACAWYLAEAGAEVTLVDRGHFDSGCSFGNCGLVCPSHVLPLPQPGAVRDALKAIVRSNSSLRVKTRWDWSLWMWFAAFARRCNTRDMLAAGRALQPLLHVSRDEYCRLSDDGVVECDMDRRGLLFAYRDATAFQAYAQTDGLLRDAFSLPAVRYDGDHLLQLEPALRPGLAGGWHYEDDLHLDPTKLMRSWHARLKMRGVRFVEGCSIDRITRVKGRATEVVSSSQALSADTFVIATGAMTPQISGALKVRVPIQPGKGYSLTFPRPAASPSLPIIFPESHVVVTPFESTLRLGSTMEFAGYDASLPAARLEHLRDAAAVCLKTPIPESNEQAWCGWRPMTYDGIPVIDRTPAFRNVWIATGHNMLGIALATGTGRLISELITGVQPLINPKPYSLARFSTDPRMASEGVKLR